MAENTTTLSMDQAASVSLSNMERFRYCCGVIGMIIPFMLPLSFVNVYWTDILLIPPALVGTCALLNRFWDAVNDPIIGALADRTNSPKGRYRIWMIPTGICTNLLCVLLFLRIPTDSRAVTYFFAFGIYFLFVMSFTATEIPHLSLMSTMTTDYAQRGILTSWRQTAASIVMMLVSATALPLVRFIAKADSFADTTSDAYRYAMSNGYFWTMLLFCVIAIPFYFLCSTGVKERVIPPAAEVDVPMTESLKCLKGNVPAFALMGCMLSWGIANGFGAGFYFFTYYVGNMGYFATNMTISNLGNMFSGMLVMFLMKYIPNKRNIGIITWAISMVIFLCQYLVPVAAGGPTWGMPVFLTLSFFRAFFAQAGFIVLFSLFPDVSEYTKAKYNLRASGFVIAISYFFWKVGMSLSTAVFNWGLAGFGYVPNAPIQNPSVINWLRLCMQILPATMSFIGIIAFYMYKLDAKTHEEALAKIAEGS